MYTTKLTILLCYLDVTLNKKLYVLKVIRELDEYAGNESATINNNSPSECPVS